MYVSTQMNSMTSLWLSKGKLSYTCTMQICKCVNVQLKLNKCMTL